MYKLHFFFFEWENRKDCKGGWSVGQQYGGWKCQQEDVFLMYVLLHLCIYIHAHVFCKNMYNMHFPHSLTLSMWKLSCWRYKMQLSHRRAMVVPYYTWGKKKISDSFIWHSSLKIWPHSGCSLTCLAHPSGNLKKTHHPVYDLWSYYLGVLVNYFPLLNAAPLLYLSSWYLTQDTTMATSILGKFL